MLFDRFQRSMAVVPNRCAVAHWCAVVIGLVRRQKREEKRKKREEKRKKEKKEKKGKKEIKEKKEKVGTQKN